MEIAKIKKFLVNEKPVSISILDKTSDAVVSLHSDPSTGSESSIGTNGAEGSGRLVLRSHLGVVGTASQHDKLVAQTNSVQVTIDNLEYEAKIIQFDQQKKLLFFEINGQAYKAKIVKTESGEISLYIFNTQSHVTVNTRQEEPEEEQKSSFIPSSLSTFPNSTQDPVQDITHKLPQKDKALTLKSPLAGRVIKVLVTQGQQVAAYQPIIIIESMKMENEICAPYNAFIKTLSIAEGNLVQQNQVLVTFGEIQSDIEGENDGATKNVYEQTAIQNR